MAKLKASQTAFKAEEITYLDRKAIQLDRMLLRFFEILRYDGRPVSRRRRRAWDINSFVEAMRQAPTRFPGFDQYPDVARSWLSSDLFEVRNRDQGEREILIGPRPFHLNAYKLINPSAVQDYGASQQVWAMLFYADRELLTLLKEFFGRGLDRRTDVYDLTTKLDLETLAVLGLADQVTVDPRSEPLPDPIRPLCLGQGRLMAEDLRCLLAYDGQAPRHVLAGYIRNALGLHLALFQLRLLRLIPALVDQAQGRRASATCPVETDTSCPCDACPYNREIIIDLTDNPASPTVKLAQASATAHYDGLARYIRAVVFLNRVKDFAAFQNRATGAPAARSVDDLLAYVINPPSNMDGFFGARIADAVMPEEDTEEDHKVQAILRLSTLSPLEKYVELVTFQRANYERNSLTHLLDALTQKNKPGGFMRQNAGARGGRWFGMGADLLEMLVQIAVLERTSDCAFRSRSLLIDDFIEWLRARYGFVIYAPAHSEVSPDEQAAWRENEQGLRKRLRQIGFFTDLSDAYNSQTLRPRYKVMTND